MAESSVGGQSFLQEKELLNFLKKIGLHHYYEKLQQKGVYTLGHLKALCADQERLKEIGLSTCDRAKLIEKVPLITVIEVNNGTQFGVEQ